MKTVFKYAFNVEDNVSIEMPKLSEIIHIDSQNNSACIWALVDTELEREIRKFRIFGTGHEIKDITTIKYIGTFKVYNGELVFHMFEEAR